MNDRKTKTYAASSLLSFPTDRMENTIASITAPSTRYAIVPVIIVDGMAIFKSSISNPNGMHKSNRHCPTPSLLFFSH